MSYVLKKESSYTSIVKGKINAPKPRVEIKMRKIWGHWTEIMEGSVQEFYKISIYTHTITS